MSYRADGHAAVDWVFDYLERVGELPVLAQVEPGDVRRSLPASPPEHAEPFADVLRDLDEVLLPAITHWQHPRYFAYFATTASEPGILAELLVAALNQVAFIWRTSPVATELEAVTLDWLAQLLGLPSGWHGHIEDTASTSTLAALAAAREMIGRRVVVCSEQANSSVDKAVRLLGMELRKTPVDDEFRLRPEALDLTDAAAVVATVGTTSTAAVDPVPEIANACEAAGAWLHVDAANAGSAWVCPELRDSQAGVERADSVVVNPHKWLFVPMDCSTLWSRRPEALRRAFSLVPEYLRTSDEADSLSDYGPALGRRFRSLKLWAVLRCFGREGLQAAIREHVRLAELFEGWIRSADGWSSRRRAASRSSASGSRPPTRRTRRSSSAPTGRASSSCRTRSSATATSCGSRSAMHGRRKPTSAGRGRFCNARRGRWSECWCRRRTSCRARRSLRCSAR